MPLFSELLSSFQDTVDQYLQLNSPSQQARTAKKPAEIDALEIKLIQQLMAGARLEKLEDKIINEWQKKYEAPYRDFFKYYDNLVSVVETTHFPDSTEISTIAAHIQLAWTRKAIIKIDLAAFQILLEFSPKLTAADIALANSVKPQNKNSLTITRLTKEAIEKRQKESKQQETQALQPEWEEKDGRISKDLKKILDPLPFTIPANYPRIEDQQAPLILKALIDRNAVNSLAYMIQENPAFACITEEIITSAAPAGVPTDNLRILQQLQLKNLVSKGELRDALKFVQHANSDTQKAILEHAYSCLEDVLKNYSKDTDIQFFYIHFINKMKEFPGCNYTPSSLSPDIQRLEEGYKTFPKQKLEELAADFAQYPYPALGGHSHSLFYNNTDPKSLADFKKRVANIKRSFAYNHNTPLKHHVDKAVEGSKFWDNIGTYLSEGDITSALDAINKEKAKLSLKSLYTLRTNAYLRLDTVFTQCPNEFDIQNRYVYLITQLEEKIDKHYLDSANNLDALREKKAKEEELKKALKQNHHTAEDFHYAKFSDLKTKIHTSLPEASRDTLLSPSGQEKADADEILQELTQRVENDPASKSTADYIAQSKRRFFYLTNEDYKKKIDEAEATVKPFQDLRNAIEKGSARELKELFKTPENIEKFKRPFTQEHPSPLHYAHTHYESVTAEHVSGRGKKNSTLSPQKLSNVRALLEKKFPKEVAEIKAAQVKVALEKNPLSASKQKISTTTEQLEDGHYKTLTQAIATQPDKHTTAEISPSSPPGEPTYADTKPATVERPKEEPYGAMPRVEGPTSSIPYGSTSGVFPLSPNPYGAMPTPPAILKKDISSIVPLATPIAVPTSEDKFANRLEKIFKRDNSDGAWHVLVKGQPNKFIQKKFQSLMKEGSDQFLQDSTTHSSQHLLTEKNIKAFYQWLIKENAKKAYAAAEERYSAKAEELQKVFADIHNNLSDEGLTELEKNQRDQVRALVKEKNTLDKPIVGGSGIGLSIDFVSKIGEEQGVAWLTGVLEKDTAGQIPAAYDAKCQDERLLRDLTQERTAAGDPVWKIVAAAPTAAELDTNPIHTAEDAKKLIRGYGDDALSGTVCLKLEDRDGNVRITKPIQRNTLNESKESTHDIRKATQNAMEAEKDTCITALKALANLDHFVRLAQAAQKAKPQETYVKKFAIEASPKEHVNALV